MAALGRPVTSSKGANVATSAVYQISVTVGPTTDGGRDNGQAEGGFRRRGELNGAVALVDSDQEGAFLELFFCYHSQATGLVD